MDLETDFYYMILLKREIILSIIILKGGFQTIQLYLLSYSVRSDSPQLFFQDLTGRLLVPTVYTGPVLHRLLYVCWISLHFVLNLTAAVVNVGIVFYMLAFNIDGYVLS